MQTFFRPRTQLLMLVPTVIALLVAVGAAFDLSGTSTRVGTREEILSILSGGDARVLTRYQSAPAAAAGATTSPPPSATSPPPSSPPYAAAPSPSGATCATSPSFKRVVTMAVDADRTAPSYALIDNDRIFFRAGLGWDDARIAADRDAALSHFSATFGVPRSQIDVPDKYDLRAAPPQNRMTLFAIVFGDRFQTVSDSAAATAGCGERRRSAVYGGWYAIGRNVSIQGEATQGKRIIPDPTNTLNFYYMYMLFDSTGDAPVTVRADAAYPPAARYSSASAARPTSLFGLQGRYAIRFKPVRPIICGVDGCGVVADTTLLPSGRKGRVEGIGYYVGKFYSFRLIFTWF